MTKELATRRAGEWSSPVSAELIARGGLRLAQPCIHNGAVYWLEGRATEQGRTVLVRQRAGCPAEDLTPAPYNVRSSAHEYGGGAFCLSGECIWFVNFEDQCIYELRPDTPPRRVTRPDKRRYADLCPDSERNRLIAVCENHAAQGEPETTLVAIALADGSLTTLASGADFYSSPSLDTRGKRLAWLSWNHPNMPWNSTTLHVAALQTDSAPLAGQIITKREDESVFQPRWGADGALYFMSDRSNWWNLHRWDGTRIEAVMDEAADCGFGQWVFGMSTWDFVGDDTVLCCGARDGLWSLGIVNIQSRSTQWLSLPFNIVEHVAAAPGRAVLLAAGAQQVMSVVELETQTGHHKILRESIQPAIDARWIASAEAISYPSTGGDPAWAFYYPPRNPETGLAESERPPLLVKCHGGPTAHTDAGLDWRIQFWTTRGFAVLDVNYRGSTGFGRAYREKLDGQWGVRDVDDAVLGARHLATQGLVDPDRMAISGGSAGGFTVLSALTFHDTFRAGTSLYGVSDLESLLHDTHKFEARYLDRLVGPYPAGQDLYRARSPLQHAGQLNCPVLFLQGLRDKVVTPDQSERMAQALRDKGLPVLYLTFPEEGHGFRSAKNIATALQAELYFYARIFGFTPADSDFSAHIENLD